MAFNRNRIDCKSDSCSEGTATHLNAGAKKTFVLDTNVVLDDAKNIEQFDEHDIVIPITVIQELDRFKRGNEDLNFQARQFLRRLDELTGAILNSKGVWLGENQGSIRVVLGGELEEPLKLALIQNSPDHSIRYTAVRLKKWLPDQQVVLVSKDTNLRLKAKSVGVIAEDCEADKLQSFDELHSGKRSVLELSTQDIDHFFTANGVVTAESLSGIESPVANKRFVIRSGTKSVLA